MPIGSGPNKKCRKCGKEGHLLVMCKAASDRASGSSSGGSGAKKQPEAAQFDSYKSFACEVIIGQAHPEGMIVEVDFARSSSQSDDTWLGDTGSSHHIKSTGTGMVNIEPWPPGTRIRQVQGFVEVHEWGTVLLEVDGELGKHVMQLRGTLIVPNISVNMFSLQRVIVGGYLPDYGEVEGKCVIKKRTPSGGLQQVATMIVVKDRSTLDCKLVEHDSSSGAALQTDSLKVKAELTIDLLHKRLGHSGNDAIQKLLRGNLVRGTSGVKIEDLCGCDFCKLGKLPQKPHPAAVVDKKGADLLDLVVVDLAGLNKPQTLGGKHYDMVIVDTFSQRFFVKLLKKKSDAADVLMRWIPQVELQTGRKLKRLRSNNGEEFLSGKFTDWLSLRGVVQQTTPSYSP